VVGEKIGVVLCTPKIRFRRKTISLAMIQLVRNISLLLGCKQSMVEHYVRLSIIGRFLFVTPGPDVDKRIVPRSVRPGPQQFE
jgi:hypothetical protein